MSAISSLKNAQPEIREIPSKIIVGNSLEMSIYEDQTAMLWRGFVPKLGIIKNRKNSDLLSIQIFPEDFDFVHFNIQRKFIKWAGTEIENTESVPEDMECLKIPAGMYAIFTHIGDQATAETTFRYIFTEWLPKSGFVLDNRPQFEVLGEKYKRNDPASEEDIYIPVKHIGSGI